MPLATLAVVTALAGAASAQAWLPPVGAGSVTLTYQRITNDGHRLTDGSLLPSGQSLNMGLYLEAEYAPVSRLSVVAGLPYVFGKYTDPVPPPPFIPYLPRDQCHCWHGGWQDWGIAARYNALRKARGDFALTPSIAFGLPSHAYEFRGESALGRHLKEARIAIDVGQRLDKFVPNLSVQGRYSYTFVERVLDILNNRSNAGVEGVYLLRRRKLAARGFVSWQRTHGGLRFGSLPPADLVFPGDVDTPDRLIQHDRLLRDNNFRGGGGFSYAFPTLDVFAFYNRYISGVDTHAGGALTIGVSWPFEFTPKRRH